jgi:hypothetical protein
MNDKKPKLDAKTLAVAKRVLAMPPKHNADLKVGRQSKKEKRESVGSLGTPFARLFVAGP